MKATIGCLFADVSGSGRLNKTVLALFVLVIPSICYMLLRTGTNHYQSLPVYGPGGPREFSDSIPEDAWFQFDPARLGLTDARLPLSDHEIYVAAFFRERLNSQAETLAVNMVRVAKSYEDLKKLKFIAFVAGDSSTGQLADSIASRKTAGNSSQTASLEQLLRSYQAKEGKWLTVPLSGGEARNLLNKGFLLQVQENGEGAPLNDSLVLIDSRRRIRGYYNGGSYFEADTLEDEIAVLWKQEKNEDEE